MFIVKSETRYTGGKSVTKLYQANRVRMLECESTDGAGAKLGDWSVELTDQLDHIHEVLHVGAQIGAWNAVWIMNENGKTIDRVQPQSWPTVQERFAEMRDAAAQ